MIFELTTIAFKDRHYAITSLFTGRLHLINKKVDMRNSCSPIEGTVQNGSLELFLKFKLSLARAFHLTPNKF